jgi:hypothetical protein
MKVFNVCYRIDNPAWAEYISILGEEGRADTPGTGEMREQ